jgi:hypothetical protein
MLTRQNKLLDFCIDLLLAGNKEGAHSSTFWVLLSIFLGAVAMLCKEQGITVLVRANSGRACTLYTSVLLFCKDILSQPASVTSSVSASHCQPEVRDQ